MCITLQKTKTTFQQKDNLNIFKKGRNKLVEKSETAQNIHPGNLTNTTTKSKLVQLKKINLNWL